MDELKIKIIQLAEEISDLERKKRGIQEVIRGKKERLEELRILTANQLDMFPDG